MSLVQCTSSMLVQEDICDLAISSKTDSKETEKKVPNPTNHLEVDGVSIKLQGMSFKDKKCKNEGSPLSDRDLLRQIFSFIEEPEWKTLLLVSTSFNKAVHSCGVFHKSRIHHFALKEGSKITLDATNKEKTTSSFINIAKALSKNGDKTKAKETLYRVKRKLHLYSSCNQQERISHYVEMLPIFPESRGILQEIMQQQGYMKDSLPDLLRISTAQAAIGDPQAQTTLAQTKNEILSTLPSQIEDSSQILGELMLAQAQCDILDEAEETLSQIKHKPTKAEALIELSKIYDKKGAIDKRDQALSQAEEIALQDRNKKALLNKLIRAQAEMGQIDEIKTAIYRLQNDMDQYTAQVELAKLYVKENQIAQAKETVKKAKEVIEADTESKESQKQLRRVTIAEIEARIDDKDGLNTTLAEIKKNLGEEKNLHTHYILESIAKIQYQIGDPQAEETFTQYKEEIRNLKLSQEYIINCLNKIAVIQSQRGDISEAEKTFCEAKKLASEIHSKELLTSIQLAEEKETALREIQQGKISEIKEKIISISKIGNCFSINKVDVIVEIASQIPAYINN